MAQSVVKPAFLLAILVVVATLWSPAEWSEIVGYFKKYSKFLILPVFHCPAGAGQCASPLLAGFWCGHVDHPGIDLVERVA
ncbi:MAG: hypothetical protein R3E42_08545 [Burkholderiaceae bacterium]